MKYKSYLVVGGAGFVGSHVVDALVDAGAEKVVIIDNLFLGNLANLSYAKKKGNVIIYREDARYLSVLESILKREKCEAVFNLAVKCLPYGFIDPEGSYMTGLEVTLNLANLLRKGCFNRLLHYSSSEAYGTAQQVQMDEKHPLKPTTPYGAGKASADLLLLSYSALFGCEVSIIRPFNMYGPRQNMDAYAAVIPTTINRILTGASPHIDGDGEQTRDLSFVRDVADASLKLLECDKALGKVVNLGSGKECKIKDIIFMICDLLNYPKERIEHHPQRPSDVRRLCADISLAKKLINYSPTTDFEDGLRITCDWCKSTYTSLRFS